VLVVVQVDRDLARMTGTSSASYRTRSNVARNITVKERYVLEYEYSLGPKDDAKALPPNESNDTFGQEVGRICLEVTRLEGRTVEVLAILLAWATFGRATSIKRCII